MNFPDSLRYTEDHEWVRLEDDGQTATIGITDYAQGELGDVVFVELEPVGEAFESEDSFGSVEAVKAVSELFMPVAGIISEHNEQLEDQPELVNIDPYGEGWMIRVTLEDVSELDDLLSAEAYAAMVS